MSKEKSLFKQTVAWIKDIPHKLEVLLNNLWTMSVSLSILATEVYMITKVVGTLNGYVAVGFLVMSVIAAVYGAFKLIHFLYGKGE